MATEPLSTTRRALLGAAASLPVLAQTERTPALAAPGHHAAREAIWSRRLARYHRLAERAREAAETGFLAEANARYAREREILADPFGDCGTAADSTEAPGFPEAAFARVSHAEEIFYNRCTAPMLRAAILVALTPAPHVPALIQKVRIMQGHHLQEVDAMPRPILEILCDDIRRLQSKRAENRQASGPVFYPAEGASR